MSNILSHTLTVKQIAKDLGFASCGISIAQRLDSEAVHLEQWLNKGYHGKMKWMENHFDKRVDPTLLVPGAKSVISFTYNYMPDTVLEEGTEKISKYAYGEDYHFVIKNALKTFMKRVNDEIGAVDGRVFVDSAPVLDRAWAAKSGLGWIGKHSLLLSKSKGSFFFIAEAIVDIELAPDVAATDHCGTCRACIDACPTDAIIQDKVVDSTKCISYLTIELKENIPSSFKNQMEGWVFGCDICQDVCPWNRFSTATSQTAFNAHPQLQEIQKEDWKELTEDVFRDVFRKSAVKRAGYVKLRQNIEFSQTD